MKVYKAVVLENESPGCVFLAANVIKMGERQENTGNNRAIFEVRS